MKVKINTKSTYADTSTVKVDIQMFSHNNTIIKRFCYTAEMY